MIRSINKIRNNVFRIRARSKDKSNCLGTELSTRAKRQLRKRLEASGESQEEIRRRVEALVEEMKAAPLPPPKPYRPVPQRKTKSKPGSRVTVQDTDLGSVSVPSTKQQDQSCEKDQ